jgi:outer membrane receptor protein involved in Fe transport
LVFYVTRPPKVVTEYAFSNRWEPPKPRLDLPPTKLIIYKPYPVEKTRVDTIRVPQNIDRYYLIESNRISRIPQGLRLDVYNVGDQRYDSWEFAIPAPNLRAIMGFEVGSDVFDYRPFVGMHAQVSYKKLDVFGNARLLQDDYSVTAGLRYNLVNFSR